MMTPEEARDRILARIGGLGGKECVEMVPLMRAEGRILAREAVSDVDLPPFEKAMMDGFAVRAADFDPEGGERTLTCIGESRAGVPFHGAHGAHGEVPGKGGLPVSTVPSGCCIEIYTGAELPSDCDAVEMQERTAREGARITFERHVRRHQHVSHVGEILGRGRSVFRAGRILSASDLAVLASVGCDPVPVMRRPRVSVLTTGDELVPPSETPGRSQIRESNTHYLGAACRRLGCEVRTSGIVRDDPAALEAAFLEALEEGDLLITTGGVSVGKYDLVGATFEKLGVEPILSKVAIKPGKPIWFGMRGDVPVFGLPGNPVSSLLGFEVFVRPALAKRMGADAEHQAERLRRGRWVGDERRSSDRQHNLPASVRQGRDGVEELTPLPFRGSADVIAASEARALVILPADSTLRTGELVDYRPLG